MAIPLQDVPDEKINTIAQDRQGNMVLVANLQQLV